MLRGMGVPAVDVAVFTNISPDHLGLQGIDTVEQLAWAKSTVVRVVRPEGWAVLNARGSAGALRCTTRRPGRPWFFALDPGGGREPARRGSVGPADHRRGRPGHLVVRGTRVGRRRPRPRARCSTCPSRSRGSPRRTSPTRWPPPAPAWRPGCPCRRSRRALRSFVPDLTASPGRMNIWTRPDVRRRHGHGDPRLRAQRGGGRPR